MNRRISGLTRRPGPWIPRLLVALLAVYGLLGATGCPVEQTEIQLTARTGPPPGKTARLVHDDTEPVIEHSVTLSNGVVMTVDCWDNCEYGCYTPTITAAEPGLVDIRPVMRLGGETTEHVLVAVAPGATTLTVSNACAAQNYDLTVLVD